MHHDSGKPSSKPSVPWQKIIGISIGCLGLWTNLSYRGLAQSMSSPVQSNYPSDNQPGNPLATSGVNIDQIMIPPAEDVPEEILRTEIIFEARSPLDGTSLSAADYAQLQTDLAASQTTLTISSDIRFLVFLLQARRSFKPVIPFLP
ncbi:MAG: hypothetical protein AAGF93_16390 [Cyanobacteria bacterium P01_H01_bin.105]